MHAVEALAELTNALVLHVCTLTYSYGVPNCNSPDCHDKSACHLVVVLNVMSHHLDVPKVKPRRSKSICHVATTRLL